MGALFELMPNQYIPQLDNAWRKDLVDLYNAGKEAKLKNTMNGFSSLKILTHNYLLLQITESSAIEMKLLPLINNTNVICMVTTVNGPVPDSQIRFFSPEWKLLNPTDLITLVDADWFLKENIDKNDLSYLEASSHISMNTSIGERYMNSMQMQIVLLLKGFSWQYNFFSLLCTYEYIFIINDRTIFFDFDIFFPCSYRI